MKKKLLVMGLTIALGLSTLTGCGSESEGKNGELGAITVVSREDGSGTRDAFTELLEITEDDVDNTTDAAEITQSTSVMMTTIAGNDAAIGYVSLGSLDDSVKTVKVDGVDVTVENINSGEYKVARPFNIATKGEVSEVAQDFIDFVMSEEGQAIVEEEGYIKVETAGAYEKKSGLSGKVTLAGSTSVAPVMEKIADAYKQINADVTIEIQQSGSSAGITSTIEGACDIGMASRDLKDSEIKEGLTSTVIAMDGIAVIVNENNSVEDLTSQQIKDIYTGEVTDWADVTE